MNIEPIANMSNAIATRLDEIQYKAGVSARDVAQLLDTAAETISRWRKGKTEPQRQLRDRLLQLHWLVSELSELYRPDEAKLWLFSPHKMLDGRRPADLIAQGKAEDVLRIIEQLKDGAYA